MKPTFYANTIDRKACHSLQTSGMLSGTRENMDDIINAIMKVYENRDKLNSI